VNQYQLPWEQWSRQEAQPAAAERGHEALEMHPPAPMQHCSAETAKPLSIAAFKTYLNQNSGSGFSTGLEHKGNLKYLQSPR